MIAAGTRVVIFVWIPVGVTVGVAVGVSAGSVVPVELKSGACVVVTVRSLFRLINTTIEDTLIARIEASTRVPNKAIRTTFVWSITRYVQNNIRSLVYSWGIF